MGEPAAGREHPRLPLAHEVVGDLDPVQLCDRHANPPSGGRVPRLRSTGRNRRSPPPRRRSARRRVVRESRVPMADPDQLRHAIEAQEQLRGAVPDDVIDATIAALQAAARDDARGAAPPGHGPVRRRERVHRHVGDAGRRARDGPHELALGSGSTRWSSSTAGGSTSTSATRSMATWGTDGAREDDPERAVRTALGLQRALADFRAATGDDLAMRVGVNTGPALVGAVGTTGELTVIGDTVNVASRLEHAAPVGGVLIAHATYRHVRGLFQVEPLGPLTVKGKQESVPAYVVHGARPRAFPIATRGVAGHRDPHHRSGRSSSARCSSAYRGHDRGRRGADRHRRRRGRHREVTPALRVRQLARAAPGERVLLRRARVREPHPVAVRADAQRADHTVRHPRQRRRDDGPGQGPRRVRRHARRTRRRSRDALGRARQRPRRRRPRARRLRRPPDRGPGAPRGLVPHPRRRPAASPCCSRTSTGPTTSRSTCSRTSPSRSPTRRCSWSAPPARSSSPAGRGRAT